MSRARTVASLVVFFALGAIGFLPLFGGPGYEHSLASGLIVPAAAAIASAVELSARRDLAPLPCLVRGIVTGVWLAAIAFVTALLHGARIGICDFWGGTLFFALGAGGGAVMGSTWGVLVAELCRGRKRRVLGCVLLSLGGPLAGIVVSVARFYTSPMIFSFDPFFGFFSGTLYDTVIDVRTELWTYRAGSFATLAGVALVASVLVRAPNGTLTASRLTGNSRASLRLALGAAALLASLVLSARGPALGHWQTASSIAAALGGRVHGSRCDVVYPDSLLVQQAALFLRDCEQELAADEKRLGAHLDGPLIAYVFRDVDQKRRLMGAAQTSIAKPWRREVYVQFAGFPHPILGHEIAHVVSGSFARGPFRIAGAFGGLWPNPGLIEGAAVATSPDDDGLTDAQWARAMLDLGLLPPLERLFTLGFLGENASKSYTAAGAFVSWVIDRWGTGIVRTWYGGGSLESLTGETWRIMAEQFLASLRALPMPPEASAYAKARFERPSVWERRCPHVVDALDRDADRCRDDHRFSKAVALYEQALDRDPRDWHARFDKARIDAWFAGEDIAPSGVPRLDPIGEMGVRELQAIASDEQAPRTWRDRALEALADVDLAADRGARAAETYSALAKRTIDEDAGRTLEVKAQSVDDALARQAIVDLLVGSPASAGDAGGGARPVDTWVGALSLGLWANAVPSGPLAEYMVGRNLALHDRYERAATWLDRALEGRSPSDRVLRELLRLRAVCACALGDAEGLAWVKARVDGVASPFAATSGGRRESLERLIARCDDRQSR